MQQIMISLKLIRLFTNAFAVFVAVLVCSSAAVRASDPSPTPAPSAAAAFCMAAIADIAPIPSTNSYALTLRSLDEHTGVASGTIALFAQDSRYNIPFAKATAVAPNQQADATPIVVHFAEPVSIDHVVVASLDGPGGGACIPVVATTALAVRMEKAALDSLLKRARTVTPIDAAEPQNLQHPNCSEPERVGRVIKAADVPALSPGDRAFAQGRFGPGTLTIPVEVVIDDQGRVVTATALRPSGDSTLDHGAAYAAQHSSYAPGRFRCESIGGVYSFVVQYSL